MKKGKGAKDITSSREKMVWGPVRDSGLSVRRITVSVMSKVNRLAGPR